MKKNHMMTNNDKDMKNTENMKAKKNNMKM